VDVLSDVLSWLRVEGTLSRRSEFSAPWGIAFPPVDHVAFLVVQAGRCFMLREGEPPIGMEAGDLVMFSPGAHTSLVDQPATPALPYGQVLEAHAPPQQDRYAADRVDYPTLRYGGGGRMTAIRGWGLRFEGDGHHPLLDLLPPIIHITYEQRSALPWLQTTLRFLLHETHHESPGSDMMSVRLVDLLFVQVLRAWFQEQPEGEAGWLGALRDASAGHALRLIHQYPADPWTVQSLAKAVGMSRSSFSSRFQSLVGSPPMKYLTKVRMNLAGIALRGDAHVSVADLAKRVGYDSESSFGRTFKRHFGVSPGVFRRRLRQQRPQRRRTTRV
jgi:AraC-like DNA-binding protein